MTKNIYCHTSQNYHASQSCHPSQKGLAGFTLLELLTTILIVGVLAAISVPSFDAQHHRIKAKAERDSLFQDLRLARSHTITRSGTVSLCPSNPAKGTTCENGGWEDGWLMYVDLNRNGQFDSADTLIKQHQKNGKRIKLISRPAVTRLTYTAEGQAQLSSGDVQILFCFGTQALSFSLARAGHTRLEPEQSQAECS
jgi:type IV fimbrial biogenesis protein FimT